MENRKVVDQAPHPALALIASRPQLFARQGAVVAVWRRSPQRRWGPYYRLRYREGSRQHAIYLGRAGRLVEHVRQALAQLQRPRRQAMTCHTLRRIALAALRPHKAGLDARLRALGLRLHGFEIRGWRTSPILPRTPITDGG